METTGRVLRVERLHLTVVGWSLTYAALCYPQRLIALQTAQKKRHEMRNAILAAENS